MINKTTVFTLLLAAFLGSCTHERIQDRPELPSKITFANDSKVVYLQNLQTRTIVICRESAYETAETCAQYFEARNYTRFDEIPYKVAKYDRLTKDTFPTRRWRPGERTPSW